MLNKIQDFADFDIISEGQFIYPDKNRHVALKDKSYFKILLRNDSNSRVQADIYLNGKVGNNEAFVASFILNSNSVSAIETYKSQGEKFVFICDEHLSDSIGANFNKEDWGLVVVRFRREAFEQDSMFKGFTFSRGVNKCVIGYKGVIGLGDNSDQTFETTNGITKYSGDIIKSVRLVKKAEFKPINSIPAHNYPI